MIEFPTVEKYEVALRPFLEKGWQVDFHNDEEAKTSVLQVNVPDLEISWRIQLRTVELTHPHLVPLFIERVNDELTTEFARDFVMPQMRIYGKTQPVAYEPANWVDFRNYLGLATFNPNSLKKGEFRRYHRIVLATPFKDYFQRQVYELDYVHSGIDNVVSQVLRDNSTGYWYLLGDDMVTRDAASVTQGTRLSGGY